MEYGTYSIEGSKEARKPGGQEARKQGKEERKKGSKEARKKGRKEERKEGKKEYNTRGNVGPKQEDPRFGTEAKYRWLAIVGSEV